MIRVVIVDDERPAREGLRVRLERAGDFEVVGEAANGRTAITTVLEHRPDLMFLDIQMPDINGFDVLRGIPASRRPRVIFVTAYDRHALEAFDAQALDYVLKPIVAKRFRTALDRARSAHQQELASRTLERLGAQMREGQGVVDDAPPDGRLHIREGSRLHLVAFDEIQWVEACGNYVTIHTRGRPLLHRITMRQLIEQLPERAFARIHRGVIVRLAEIEAVQFSSHGDGRVQLRGGATLRLSRRFRHALG